MSSENDDKQKEQNINQVNNNQVNQFEDQKEVKDVQPDNYDQKVSQQVNDNQQQKQVDIDNVEGVNNTNTQVINDQVELNNNYNLYNDNNNNVIVDINANNLINSEYYNEGNIPKYNDIIEYENQLRQEIELTTPLVSELKPIQTLIDEYKDSIFSQSIKTICEKYKFIKYVRRDGNCFYRAYIYRLFEHCCLNNDLITHNEVLKKIEGCKDLLEFNGFQWIVVEDFFNVFVQEFKLIMTLNNEDRKPYLEILFADKDKGSYMIAFLRIYISAYIKENRLLYENFIFDEDLDSWCRREVEPIDVECDNLQIIATTNCFNTGVLIENLGEKKIETMKLPEDGCTRYFTHLFFRPGHYDILYNN
jgi:ubiquitin thioesterase protein OTUB1